MIYHNLPFSQYLKIDALSSTAFKDFVTSPTLYKWNKDNPREASAAQDFGTIAHGFILERETFYNDFVILEEEEIKKVKKFRETEIDLANVVVCEKMNRNTKIYKEIVKENPDKAIMFTQEYDAAMAMLELDMQIGERMMVTKELDKDLNDLGFQIEGNNEVSVEFVYRGVKCKARFDSYTDDHLIRDLKTSANPYNFEFEIKKWKYWLQAAFYTIAYRESFSVSPRGFEFIVVPNKQPYSDISIHNMHQEYIEYGIEVIDKHIDNFKWCLEQNDFKREPQFNDVYKPTYLV